MHYSWRRVCCWLTLLWFVAAVGQQTCARSSNLIDWNRAMMDELPYEFPPRPVEAPLGKLLSRLDYFGPPGNSQPDLRRLHRLFELLDVLNSTANHSRNITIVFLGGSFTTGRMPGLGESAFAYRPQGYSNVDLKCHGTCRNPLNQSDLSGDFSLQRNCPACAYPARFEHYLRTAYSAIAGSIFVHNLAQPGSTSLSISSTLGDSLRQLPPVDAFFVTYVDNDRNFHEQDTRRISAGFEILVRFLLSASGSGSGSGSAGSGSAGPAAFPPQTPPPPTTGAVKV